MKFAFPVGYSYIDVNGILQTVRYTADAKNGFRVHASNLPESVRNNLQPVRDTPEVELAKKRHLEELRQTEVRNQRISSYLSYLSPYNSQLRRHDYSKKVGLATENELGVSRIAKRRQDIKNPFLLSQEEARTIAVPQPDPPPLKNKRNYSSGQKEVRRVNHQSVSSFGMPRIQQPLSVPTPYVVPLVSYKFLHSSLRQIQDSLGQYDYSYIGDTSAKRESRSLDGTTRGAYSYIDANGLLQQVHYIADQNGFRVFATNLP